MWIIPKTLSAFVPATEGLKLESSELAWMLESSAMWRSKPSSKQTWLRRLNRNSWLTALSTRILKPSLHESFVEKYTDSLEDIHANHSVQQASDKEKKTQDTYGHTSSSTSGQLDLFGAFGKMSQDTPRWGYGESCPIWKKKVTDARGAYSVRKKLALHTKGSECSSWPTAQTSDSNGAADPTRKAHRTQLRDVETGHLPQGKNWATPQASDHIEGARTAKESNQKCLGRDLNQMNGLQDQEKSNTSGKNHGSWPTPRVGGHEKAETSIKRGRGVSLTGAVAKDATQTPKLNPSWVEQLMGLSTGWTDLGSWGMELSPKQQN